jgi:hypothetical protein
MNLDASFPTTLGKETRFPIDTTQQRKLDAAVVSTLGLGEGEWFGVAHVGLTKALVGYVVSSPKGELQLLVFDPAKKRVTDTQVVAAISRLEGAYEKTTSAVLTISEKRVVLVITHFLRDFEFDAPGAKNSSGAETRTLVLLDSKFSVRG